MHGSGLEAVPSMTRVWSDEHQTAFARATGDVNPMHMDAQVARRTLAGGRAVHGVHVALWALDASASVCPLDRLSTFQIRFERFVLVGDRTLISIDEAAGERLKLSVSVGDARVLTLQALLTGARAQQPRVEGEATTIPAEPVVVEASGLADLKGMFRILDPAALSVLVPGLAYAVGPSRVAAIGALSTLVGMFVPGLHSILSKINVTFTDATPAVTRAESGLTYAVKRFQPLLQSITTQAHGPGIDARVESFIRPRPVEPASLAALKDMVRPGEFADVSALIVGGSRGLGATTAKLIAAGGGKVAITFLNGSAEAERVASEINGARGHCEILRYDARARTAEQLRDLQLKPSQLYHFATPQIFRQKSAAFDPALCAEMMQIYNYAFHDLCQICLEHSGRLRAFYPSTVAIDEPPRDALEYVTAKSAGEALVTMMGKSTPGLTVTSKRLPRTETDQTATIFPVPAAASSAVMLPIIREISA